MIDLVLGGHDHFWYREKVQQTFFAKSGTNFRNLGLMRVRLNPETPNTDEWFDDVEKLFQSWNVPQVHKPVKYELKSERGVVEISYAPLDMVEAIPKDPQMDKYVSEKIDRYNEGRRDL